MKSRLSDRLRGWKILAVLLTLTAACTAAFAWALMVMLIFGITHTGFDLSPMWARLWLWMLIGGLPAAFFFQFFVHWSSMWTDRLPEMSDAPDAATLTGATVGLLIATIGSASPLAWLLSGSATLIFGFLAFRMLRSTVVDVREDREEQQRLDGLHERGVPTRAIVEGVHFLHSWRGARAMFEVTAAYDSPSGRHGATGIVLSDPAAAPVVGGTVLLWFVGDGSDTDNIDMDEDPQSIRDPEAAAKYEVPRD